MLSFSLIKEKKNGFELDLSWSWPVLLRSTSLLPLLGIRSSNTLDWRSGAPGLWGLLLVVVVVLGGGLD